MTKQIRAGLAKIKGMTGAQIQAAGVTGLMALGLTAQQAQAAIDVTAATTGIADAATALGLVIAALMTLSVGIFGVTKVYRFISSKAGA